MATIAAGEAVLGGAGSYVKQSSATFRARLIRLRTLPNGYARRMGCHVHALSLVARDSSGRLVTEPAAVAEAICASYAYVAKLVNLDGEMVDALPVIRSLGSNTTWGSPIRNRNLLFLPRR